RAGAAAEVRPHADRARGDPHADLRAGTRPRHAVSPGRIAAVCGAPARIDGARAVSVLLEAREVSKRFGGVQALDAISFSIERGAIYGLIGPNGAGKTTLFNTLTGIYPTDGGGYLFDGKPLKGLAPDRATAAGIARTFQNIRLFANLSALENVMIGRHVRTRAGVIGAVLRGPRTRAEEAAIERRAVELLEYVGIRARANDAAGSLPYGDQRRLEIAGALATDPKLLALDEPAAGMNPSETLALKKLLERIRADGGPI